MNTPFALVFVIKAIYQACPASLTHLCTLPASAEKRKSAFKVSPLAFQALAKSLKSLLCSFQWSRWRRLRQISLSCCFYCWSSSLTMVWRGLVSPVRKYYDKPPIVKVDEPPSYFRTHVGHFNRRCALTDGSPWVETQTLHTRSLTRLRHGA